jgi:hypothetical protein
VPEPSSLEDETVIEKLQIYQSADTVQISGELIQAGGKTLRSDIHEVFNPIWNKKNCYSNGMN